MYEVVNNNGDVVKRGSKGACCKWLIAQGYHATTTAMFKLNERFWIDSAGNKLVLLPA